MVENSIVDYLVQERRTFAEEPFNLVDGLVMATLSYLKFESCETLKVTSPESVPLFNIITGTKRDDLLRMGWMKGSPHTETFLAAIVQSPRYRDVRACLYADEHVDNAEKQFSAVTFLPGDGRAYLVFRGTDGTMVGWKENFNITFREFTPAQLTGVQYTCGVASAFDERLVLIGHSKGGSHAQYAALCVPDKVFDRVDMTINFDGPSFLGDPSPRVNDPRYIETFHKIVPEGSLFGLLLEQGDNYRVIAANPAAGRQHEPFSWVIDNCDFRYVEDLRKRAKLIGGTLNAWLKLRTIEEREMFIDIIYDLLRSTDAQTIFDLRDRLGSNLRIVATAAKELDPETRAFVYDTMKKLGVAMRQERHRANLEKKEARRAEKGRGYIQIEERRPE